MTILNKILLIIIGVLIVSAGGFIVYQQYVFDKQSKEIQNSVIEMKRLKDEIIRSQSEYVNQKGFDDFVKQNQINLATISDDVKSLGGKIVAVNQIVVTSKGQAETNVPTTTTVPNPNPPAKVDCTNGLVNCVNDKFDYFKNIQKIQLNESFNKIRVPIGEVSFNAGSVDNKPWGFQIRPREYRIDSTIAHTKEGRTIVYNALTIKADNNDFIIPITNSKTVERYPDSSFSFWNPRIAFGFSGSASFTGHSIKAEATPTINMSIMSYGKTRMNPDIRVISVGAGYNMVDRLPAVELSPIQFNIGKAVSGTLLNNLYVGPTLGANTSGSFQAGVGLQVGL